MTDVNYRFLFEKSIPLEEVAGTLRLSVLACESLHGESRVALDARHEFEPRLRRCTISGSTTVGGDLARLFESFLRREFGPGAYRVERLQPSRV